MSKKFNTLCCIFWVFQFGRGIVRKDSIETFANESFGSWQCLEPRRDNENLMEIGESMFACAKKNLYVTLMDNMDSECVDMGDGLTFTRLISDPTVKRENFPDESSSLRTLFDASSDFFSRRSARWDLGFMYPGLVMRIGPTMSGSGFLEFGLEKRLDYHDRAKLGPGQIIVRRAILPHLLGFRMNLSNILPIILGLGLIISKNAFIFSKVTLAVFMLLTIKSLFLLQTFRNPGNNVDHHHHHQYHQQASIPHDTVNFDDDSTLMTINNRPRPQGYSIPESMADSFITQVLKKLNSQQNANKNLVPKPSRLGKSNFSWGRRK